MYEIYRGTTPTFEIPLNFDSTLLESLYVSFEQNEKVIFERDIKGCELKSESIEVKLTQAETLLLRCDCLVSVQARARLKDDTTISSDIEYIKVCNIIKDGVI